MALLSTHELSAGQDSGGAWGESSAYIHPEV